MARLLVSVRSADEARAAVLGGASMIDVKDPERGPLGCADFAVWEEVRAAVPSGTPISVALGELTDWVGRPEARDHAARPCEEPTPNRFRGFCFRKMGLAGTNDQGSWRLSWERLRRHWGDGPSWVAVIYADWERACAPPPDRVLEAALGSDDCAGLLVDTWDKSHPSPVDLGWRDWFDRARGVGLLTALAGGLDVDSIGRLAALRPDIVAVRGAACFHGDRLASVDPARVSRLAQAAALV